MQLDTFFHHLEKRLSGISIVAALFFNGLGLDSD
jgi:hypothetical protein